MVNIYLFSSFSPYSSPLSSSASAKTHLPFLLSSLLMIIVTPTTTTASPPRRSLKTTMMKKKKMKKTEGMSILESEVLPTTNDVVALLISCLFQKSPTPKASLSYGTP